MDRFCHLNLTKKWALKENYSLTQSKAIAKACWNFDRFWWTKPWAHFTLCGAHFASFLFLCLAKFSISERFLGYAIHAKQDAIAHGLIIPWSHKKYLPEIDSWESADLAKREKLEKATRKILRKARQCLI